MITLGEIFRRYGPAYRARFGCSLSPSQLHVMQALAQCRTEALGGHVYSCPSCQFTRYSYHSCRNRHCTVSRAQHPPEYCPRVQAARRSVKHFRPYNGNANWWGMDWGGTRPVRASAQSSSTNCANGTRPRPIPAIATRFTS
jgi:Transposase zinc-binding domain